jgi:hypothetical protein
MEGIAMVAASKSANISFGTRQPTRREMRLLCYKLIPDNSIEIPANFWIIRLHDGGQVIERNEMKEKCLVAFSSERKAAEYLSRRNESSRKFVFFCLSWLKLVKKFKETYRYVRIDPKISGEPSLKLLLERYPFAV